MQFSEYRLLLEIKLLHVTTWQDMNPLFQKHSKTKNLESLRTAFLFKLNILLCTTCFAIILLYILSIHADAIPRSPQHVLWAFYSTSFQVQILPFQTSARTTCLHAFSGSLQPSGPFWTASEILKKGLFRKEFQSWKKVINVTLGTGNIFYRTDKELLKGCWRFVKWLRIQHGNSKGRLMMI